MSLKTPKLVELKTELIAVLDYIQPSLPTRDSDGIVMEPRSSIQTQSNELRTAMSANMFADLLAKIGAIKPSEIEVSARFLQEIVRLIEEYERVIAPARNLVAGSNSIIQALREDISNLVSINFPGLREVPTDLSLTPSVIVEAVLAPFYPEARALSSNGNVVADRTTKEFISNVWGSTIDFSTVSTPNFLIRNNPQQRRITTSDGEFVLEEDTSTAGDSPGTIAAFGVFQRPLLRLNGTAPTTVNLTENTNNGSGPFTVNTDLAIDQATNEGLAFTATRFGSGPFVDAENFGSSYPQRMLSVGLDWLAQYKAIVTAFPGYVGTNTSPHSLLTDEAIDGDILGFAKALLFDFTTSNAYQVRVDTAPVQISPPRRARASTYVTTDAGYPNALSRVKNKFNIMSKTPLITWLNAPENVLRQDTMIALRDGFILDTPLASEQGFENVTVNPLQNSTYKLYSETLVEERKQIVETIREIIAGNASPLIQGPPGDFLPGLTADSILQTGSGFRGCKFLAIPSAIGSALQHDSCVILASLFDPDITTVKDRYLGARITFGEGWLLQTVRSIVRSFLTAKAEFGSEISFIEGFDERQADVDQQQADLVERIRRLRQLLGNITDVVSEMNYRGRADASRISDDTINSIIEEYRALGLGEIVQVFQLEEEQELVDSLVANASALMDQLEDVESQLLITQYESVEDLYDQIVNTFPYANAFGPTRYERINEGTVAQALNTSWFIGVYNTRPLNASTISTRDPIYKDRVANGELIPSELLDAVDEVILALLDDCTARITALGSNITAKEVGNYAYMYFMTAGKIADLLLCPTAARNNNERQFNVFTHRALSVTGDVIVLANTPELQKKFAEIIPFYSRVAQNTIGFGGQPPTGAIDDPMQNSINFVNELGKRLTDALPSTFSAATEAVNRAAQALRQRFGQKVTISSGDIKIPLNMLDYLLETVDFAEFADRARAFVNLRSLTPVTLLASNNIDSGLGLLQFALYALTQSPLTKLQRVTYGDFEIPYNKVAAFGVSKELMPLITKLPTMSENRAIRRGFGRMRVLERQLDPGPSIIDSITSPDGLQRGSRYLQAIDSAGQPVGGWPTFLECSLDYAQLVTTFSLYSPAVTIRYVTSDELGDRVTKTYTVSLASSPDTVPGPESEMLSFARTFIRSEALKIYYYFMTGFIFEPEFAPDPNTDDSSVTVDLISTDPIKRLQSLVDVFVNNRGILFRQIILVPFVSDNDSIEEFTGILSFDT